MLLLIADKLLLIFHLALIFFNLFGWAWKATRRANLCVLLLTGFSWTVLGAWYGLGYCPCTHAHWVIKEKLGVYDMPSSYIKYLADSMTGLDISSALLDWLTAISFAFALIVSVFLNYSDKKHLLKPPV